VVWSKELMKRKYKTEIDAHGIRALLSRHPEIRKLKRYNTPSFHGNRFWKSSWLLMDYFKKNRLAKGAQVLEIGCGWGLASIYLAKYHGAKVTGVDIDPAVLPFFDLHCQYNGVNISRIEIGYEHLTEEILSHVDILIGSDICFWDQMKDNLEALITRAMKAGVKKVVIADPVRDPFKELCKDIALMYKSDVTFCEISDPKPILGEILTITA
jgi:predicted nicotinamide N-methyase